MSNPFIQMLKDVENPQAVGKRNGEWFPHTSPEGGTRTLGFGHKLSVEEEEGNFVRLPDGTVVPFDERGLTDSEVEALLQSDVASSRQVAQRQWEQHQDVPFDQLAPVYQELLTEITFNVGGIARGGRFQWPSLAGAIKDDDIDTARQEIMRSFTDPSSGERIQLTTRDDRIQKFIDQRLEQPAQQPLEEVVTEVEQLGPDEGPIGDIFGGAEGPIDISQAFTPEPEQPTEQVVETPEAAPEEPTEQVSMEISEQFTGRSRELIEQMVAQRQQEALPEREETAEPVEQPEEPQLPTEGYTEPELRLMRRLTGIDDTPDIRPENLDDMSDDQAAMAVQELF